MNAAVYYVLDHSASFLERWVWRDLATLIVMCFCSFSGLWAIERFSDRLWGLAGKNRSIEFWTTLSFSIAFSLAGAWVGILILWWSYKRLFPPETRLDVAIGSAIFLGLLALVILVIVMARGRLRFAWLAAILSIGVFVLDLRTAPNGNSGIITTVNMVELSAIVASAVWVWYEWWRYRHAHKFPEAQPRELSIDHPPQRETRHPSQDG